MDTERFKFLTQMLMFGTEEEKEYATKELDKLFAADQKENIKGVHDYPTD